MSTPPIPPELVKLGIFFDFKDEVGWCFKPQGSSVWEPLHFLEQRLRSKFPLSTDVRNGMEIRALCEQFWRKRAERWAALNSKIIDKYAPIRGHVRMTPSDSKRMDAFLKGERVAMQSAEDWRAWAEQ
jgi:hypothetical protein